MLRQTILKESQPLLRLINTANAYIEDAIEHNYNVDIHTVKYQSGVKSLSVLSFTRNAIDNDCPALDPAELLESVRCINIELKRLRLQDFDVYVEFDVTRTGKTLRVSQVYVSVTNPKLEE